MVRRRPSQAQDAYGAFASLEGLKLRRGHFARTLVLLEFEAHPLAFIEAGETCALNGGDVYEHIAAAGFRLNESEAFLLVEPLYGAGSHVDLVFRYVSAGPGGPMND